MFNTDVDTDVLLIPISQITPTNSIINDANYKPPPCKLNKTAPQLSHQKPSLSRKSNPHNRKEAQATQPSSTNTVRPALSVDSNLGKL